MKRRRLTKAAPAVLLASVAALALFMSIRVHPVQAFDARSGPIHIVKDCSAFTSINFPYCTITFSSLAQIPPGVVGKPAAGSLVVYDQPANNFAGMLDSNVVLYVGVGDWAAGRCTLNPDGNTGLCTFSDGVGQLAGFTARVNVTYVPTAANPYLFAWNGTYSFNSLSPK
ncbi:MAG TPA: hypothetical protein VMS37_10670 [Verrucomicrobiae bacterium]|nr:hypothetical protein [Verrucomicrobiae bacterium]